MPNAQRPTIALQIDPSVLPRERVRNEVMLGLREDGQVLKQCGKRRMMLSPRQVCRSHRNN